MLSSLAFGILHADLVAGTIAGLFYGMLTLRTGHIGEAISHTTTNFLIALSAIALGQWSL